MSQSRGSVQLLYVIHAVLAGIAYFLCVELGIKHGMTFSHGFIDFVLLYPKSTHAIWLLVIGPIWALVYYGTFRWLIVRFNLKTPGREVEQAVETRDVEGNELSQQLVLAFGGRSNIKNLDACITRLRVELGNVSLANAERLKALGAAGVITLGNSMQAIFGTQAENLKTAMAEYLESAGPEADLAAAPPVAVASTAPAVTQSAVVDPEIEKKGRQFIAALGGPSNIEELEPCAETRLRLKVRDESAINDSALQAAGAWGLMRVADRTMHLLVGPHSDRYAVEMKSQLATSS